MCELCGQYVILTDGSVRGRYFKHSAYEESKSCPERTFGAAYVISYDAGEHELPIRIVGVSSTSFRFELGLLRAPISPLSKEFCVEIVPVGQHATSFVYAKERLNDNSITYLSIGDRPFAKYTLRLRNGNDKLRAYWPSEINGINPGGTLFDQSTGKKLPNDADVEIGKEYYLLIRGNYLSRPRGSSVHVREISKRHFNWEAWTLFEVSASCLDEDAARFFLDFHCRLTDHPISLQPVWPLYTEGSYVVKHNQNSMYMLVEGNAGSIKAFPKAAVHELSTRTNQAKLYKVSCAGRQQLISAGRSQALQYTYIWREALLQQGSRPEVEITDLLGNKILAGETTILPQDGTIRFRSIYDGKIIISNDNGVIEERELSADKYLELDKIVYGLIIQVAVGLDIIWQVSFTKEQNAEERDDEEMLRWITSVSGVRIPVPHTLRNIQGGLRDYPQLYKWIQGCIKGGTISEQSYRRLQAVYRNIRMGDKGI